MGTWTVQHGEQALVIESATNDDRIIIDIPTGTPFVTDRTGARDLRTKLGLAIGDPLVPDSPGSQS